MSNAGRCQVSWLPGYPAVISFCGAAGLPLRASPGNRATARSHPTRIGLRHIPGMPSRHALERLDGAGLVDVDHGVELLRQTGVKVVALALGLGSIDHADRALEARFHELGRRRPAA